MTGKNSFRAAAAPREYWSLLALACLFLALTAWSWRKWTDSLVDFGLQLYTPWQLSEGRVLYRDISSIAGGPLSQYFHALLFRLLGVHYLVIAQANLVMAALLTWGVFRLFARAADWLTALVAAVVMLCVFIFGHLHHVGNYNFITPYTCETTDGFALAVLGIALICRWLASGENRCLFVASLAAGGVFLTKPEIFLALGGAMIAALTMRMLARPQFGFGIRLRSCVAFAAGFAAPVALFVIYFAVVWSPAKALGAAAGAWTPLLGGRAGHGQYYDWCLGLDYPGENLFQLAQYTVAAVLLLGVVAMGARLFQRRNRLAAWLVWAALTVFLFSPLNRLEWMQSGRALPLATVGGLAIVGSAWFSRRGTPAGNTLAFPLVWGVFAVLMLMKMGLFPRLWHYGYYLALPATLFCIYVALWILPPSLALFEVNPKFFRAGLCVFAFAGLISLLRLSGDNYAAKTFTLGGGNGFKVFPAAYLDRGQDEAARPEALQLALSWVVSNTPPTSTLAVLPEGAMINFLARRRNPTPYVVACPHELQVAGEANVMAAYATNPPDMVLLTHRSTAEFGVDYFGKDERYGSALMRWVKANYAPVWVVGSEPLQTNVFGLEMFVRKRS